MKFYKKWRGKELLSNISVILICSGVASKSLFFSLLTGKCHSLLKLRNDIAWYFALQRSKMIQSSRKSKRMLQLLSSNTSCWNGDTIERISVTSPFYKQSFFSITSNDLMCISMVGYSWAMFLRQDERKNQWANVALLLSGTNKYSSDMILRETCWSLIR